MARICLLLTLCSLFAAAWQGDRAHQKNFLVARLKNCNDSTRLAYGAPAPRW